MKIERARLCLLAAAALLASCHRAPSGSYQAFRHPMGLFDCEIPRGWTVSPPGYAGEPRALFLEPASSDAKPESTLASLWVQYYGPDSIYKDSASFVRMQLIPSPGRQVEKAQDEAIGGRAFKSISVRRQAAGSSMTGTVSGVFETLEVLEAKRGFYVLGLTYPAERSNPDLGLRSDFDHLVRSFRPAE
jgi:hypothetical protein